MYGMVCLGPNIPHLVGLVGRFMSNPGKGHWSTVKWILHLKGFTNVGLFFDKGSSLFSA